MYYLSFSVNTELSHTGLWFVKFFCVGCILQYVCCCVGNGVIAWLCVAFFCLTWDTAMDEHI